MPLTEELQHLWGIRGLDEQIAAIRAVLAGFPQQRAQLETRVQAEMARLEQLKHRMNELQKVRREREREIEAASEQERKFQSQLPAVKKNEEYTALLHEIDGMKAKRSDLETQVLVQLDEEEKIHQERPALEQALARAQQEAEQRRGEIDAREKDERDRMAALEAERGGLLAKLSTRSRYERIHGSKEGRAVVPIAKGACGGCFRGQPPQVLQEARRGDRLLTCDGCGRLLIWPPETT
jgi:predicted  nucleic acid-binding Zn-ribbon protein